MGSELGTIGDFSFEQLLHDLVDDAQRYNTQDRMNFKTETSILDYFGMRRVMQRTVLINKRLLSVHRLLSEHSLYAE